MWIERDVWGFGKNMGFQIPWKKVPAVLKERLFQQILFFGLNFLAGWFLLINSLGFGLGLWVSKNYPRFLENLEGGVLKVWTREIGRRKGRNSLVPILFTNWVPFRYLGLELERNLT